MSSQYRWSCLQPFRGGPSRMWSSNFARLCMAYNCHLLLSTSHCMDYLHCMVCSEGTQITVYTSIHFKLSFLWSMWMILCWLWIWKVSSGWRRSYILVWRCPILVPSPRFLGIAVTRDENGLHLWQEWYAQEILPLFHFSSTHHCSTLFSPGTKLRTKSGAVLSQHDATLYRSIVGSMMYLILADWPYLSYAVGAVSQYHSTPSVDHLGALHHILGYIWESANLQLQLMRCSDFDIIPKASSSKLTVTQPHSPMIVWDTAIAGYNDSN